MYLLDTDFLVELLRNNKHALSKLKKIITSGNEIYTSLIQTISILSFDKEASFISGKIEAQQESRGRPIGQNDVFIASVAIKNNLRLITRNKKHFDSIDNLQLEEW
ncbi:MAG: type II toxin-antitoxin system VapC family toxin [Nanoarchaeota archaeon]|nr:type II toxin-antitoxin system VapC family toxin [Nanoarchaeota archaeon]